MKTKKSNKRLRLASPVLTRVMVIVLLMAASAVSGGCSLKPWLKPYERAHLADPIMALSRDPVDESYLAHVYEAREAMRGADGSAGGGCGCN